MTSPAAPLLCLLLPCYNEEEILRDSSSQLKALYEQLIQDQIIHEKSIVVFIDDGSRDST